MEMTYRVGHKKLCNFDWPYFPLLMKFSSEIFSSGEVSLKFLARRSICKMSRFFSRIPSIDKMFNASFTLLNDSCHPNIKIVNNALQHVCRNSPDFAFDVLF